MTHIGIIRALEENGIIVIEKVNKYRINKDSGKIVKKHLTEDQESVYKSVDFYKHDTYLLYGVTGSGKTEVYIKWIEKCIDEGKTAIMLVPEIGLTTQIAKRFYEAFGSDVAIFHSSLSEGEKYDEYLKILRGEVHVVVGTRSAVFVPLKNLGIIIIDEEDSSSYKQDNNPRYNAKQVAIKRAELEEAKLILGSATPSIETYYFSQKNLFKPPHCRFSRKTEFGLCCTAPYKEALPRALLLCFVSELCKAVCFIVCRSHPK